MRLKLFANFSTVKNQAQSSIDPAENKGKERGKEQTGQGGQIIYPPDVIRFGKAMEGRSQKAIDHE